LVGGAEIGAYRVRVGESSGSVEILLLPLDRSDWTEALERVEGSSGLDVMCSGIFRFRAAAVFLGQEFDISMKPHVIFISGREASYIRNRVLLVALGKFCDVTILTGTGPNIPFRTLTGLIRFMTYGQKYDICWAGFYGQPLAILLSLIQRKPTILDAYVSTYDTLCEDRGLFHPRSLPGRLAYWLDQKSCQKASLVITDTQANAQYFAQEIGVPKEKLKIVYVGCDETLFYPRTDISSSSVYCEVFYYGSFLPLHGIEVIVQAAAMLKNRKDIHFTIGGYGPQFGKINEMIRRLELKNVSLAGWIPMEHLPVYIARASICLGGHFSTVPKAARVISTKTFQFVAMRKPTIVGDNEANRELFVHKEHVYAVPMGDPVALAEAIGELADAPALREHIAEGGYTLFQEKLTIKAIANRLWDLLNFMVV
jgi:glycosyltransferase involved in cell wall biosynthesis